MTRIVTTMVLTTALCVPFLARGQSAAFLKVAGADHFLLLKGDGTVWGFGECADGQLAQSPCQFVATPAPIALPGPAVDAAVTGKTSYALLDDGRVYSWGSDANGELGRGGVVPRGSHRPAAPAPGQVAGPDAVTQIAASGASAAVVTRGGEVWVWGWPTRSSKRSASEAARTADLASTDLASLTEAELQRTLGSGPLCRFAYEAGKAAVAAATAPGAGAGRGVIKVHGRLVVTTARSPASAGEGSSCRAALSRW